MALPHSPSVWSLQHTGVVCFVKDNPQRSYFIRMFDLKVTLSSAFTPRVWSEGLLSADDLSMYFPGIEKLLNNDARLLTSYVSNAVKLTCEPCFSTDREAGLGAGALQPDCLQLAATVLSYLPCRCKHAPRLTPHPPSLLKSWCDAPQLFVWVTKPQSDSLSVFSLFTHAIRTVRSDWTSRPKRKQTPSKMLSRIKSTRDKTVKVSEVTRGLFLEWHNMKCLLLMMLIANRKMFMYFIVLMHCLPQMKQMIIYINLNAEIFKYSTSAETSA